MGELRNACALGQCGRLTRAPPLQVDSPDHRIEKESALVLMPGGQRVPLPCADLPEVILQAITTVVVRVAMFRV